jgi:Zn-dependent protease
MIAFGKYRPYIALASGLIFIISGMLPIGQIIGALDFNVLLMIGGTMGLVQLFIDSHMPERLADIIMEKVPNVQWAAVALALSRVPAGNLTTTGVQVFRMNYLGADALIFPADNTYVPLKTLLSNLPYYPGEALIKPVFGSVAGNLYQMLGYFCMTNLVLCLFNLLPIPPLDGYHVLNDLILRRRQLFANPQTARIASTVLFVLVITGVVGRGIGWLDTKILAGAGNIAASVLRAFGLM